MPWMQIDPMNERMRFVQTVQERKATFSSVCATFGVSPKTGYKWWHQFMAEGAAGLADRSRRPRTNRRAISVEVGERLVGLRREHPTWGPKKLVAWLETWKSEREWPAPSTVGELLKQLGLVRSRKRVRNQRPRTEPLRHADRPNAVWRWPAATVPVRCGAFC